MFKIVRITFGIILIFMGIVGLVFPVIPGTLFLLAGILVLSIDVRLFRRLSTWIEQRYPKLGSALKKAREALQKYDKQNQPPPPENPEAKK